VIADDVDKLHGADERTEDEVGRVQHFSRRAPTLRPAWMVSGPTCDVDHVRFSMSCRRRSSTDIQPIGDPDRAPNTSVVDA
jgi:hypothetical protein